jgi:hypothetical protein
VERAWSDAIVAEAVEETDESVMMKIEEADAKPALLADAEALAARPEHTGRIAACRLRKEAGRVTKHEKLA